MYNNKRNFAIELDIDERINKLKEVNDSSYKRELNRLLKLGLNVHETLINIELLEKKIDSLSRLLSLNFELSKQIYADLNFPIKDVKNSESLNKFLSNRRTGRFNE